MTDNASHTQDLAAPDKGARPKAPLVPTTAQCLAWWDRFGMLPHIREHCRQVAGLSVAVAELAVKSGVRLGLDETRAAGLLHDLAKTYTIRWGGNHSQLGGAWVKELTGNVILAQTVVHHVFWPFELDIDLYPVQLIVLYSDKRVRHTEVVTLDERFEDIYTRYGKTEDIRGKIGLSEAQARRIERILSDRLGMELNAHTLDRGRLV